MQQYAQVNQMYWNGSTFEYVFYVSVILILAFEKRKTYKLIFGLFPIVMIAGMFNPVTSAAVSVFFDDANVYYVRLFSIVPVFYCIAHGGMQILKKMRGFVKLCGVCIVVALVVFSGHCIYREPWMQRAENPEKVPNEAISVLKAIPHEKRDTCVAFPDPLYLYARQINGSILMPYGRQLSGSPNQFLDELNKPVPDVPAVMTMAGNQSVDYIVVNRSDEAKAAFSDGGYEPIGETAGYYIYPVTGVNKTVRKLNEKRQIESTTYCDPDGKPTNNGIVIVVSKKYEYDQWGNQTKEAYYDKDDNRVTTIDGYSGIKTGYKRIGLSWLVDTMAYLDIMDRPLLASGRYMTRYAYNKKKLVDKESYYDLDGQLMNRLDTGYASVVYQYDESNRIVSERYADISGNPVISSAGYAGYTRQYDDSNRITAMKYYNTEGAIANNSDGFAEWNRIYDNKGNTVKETFIDERGLEVDIRRRVLQDTSSDLLHEARKESVENSVGIGYKWHEDGSCTVTGEAKGISWNPLWEGDRPYYFFNGETYSVSYSAETVALHIYFYEDASWKNQIGAVYTKDNTEFTVPSNCGAMIIRLWVAPGTSVNETVNPQIFVKAS